MLRRLIVLLAILVVPSGAVLAQASLPDVFNAVSFRNIGPFRSGSWITDIAVPDAPLHDHLYTIYAASRSGGLVKTTNGGVTWDFITDSIEVAAVGAVAVSSSNPNVVWMGTGANDNARSSYSGKGVYKSMDAGKTWQLTGLTDSHHIARIVIHPTNPNIVYVAAIGHLFSTNEERGVFRTMDGGRTWTKVLYINDRTGAIELVLNRANPSVVYAAMYDKQRMPWRLIEGGPESGLFRSDNGGTTWRKLTGGLPTGTIGRIGLDIYQKDPRILYALVENLNARSGGRGANPGAVDPGQLGGVPPQGVIGNEVYRTADGGVTWTKTTDINVAGGKAPYSFNQIRIDPNDSQHLIVTSDAMTVSSDGGKTWQGDYFRASFGDFRAMWFDPQDPQRVLLGSDGGVQISFDGGRTSDYFPNQRLGEAYAIGIDMDDPYHVYAGFQDHDSWKGPVNGRWGVITLEDWITVGPGDGMYNVIDPTDSRWVYNTREMNQLGRMDQRTGVRTDIRPTRPAGQPRLRYNWIAPIALSPHDPKTLYAGAQVLFRSRDRGDNWEEISPDLTTNDASKIGFPSTPYCTITSISESPLTAGVIWIGTDDGKVHITRDAGKNWTELTRALTTAGAPAERWVSRVFASPHDAGTAYVSKSGFRNDDFKPYLYRTTDYGSTWTAIASDLPNSPINVVVQDRKNRDLLFVGNDLGVFVSIDAGAHWTRLKANLPTVAVHDLQVHPRENDLVLATYGRALWAGDVSFLQELTPAVLQKKAHLFDIEPKARYGFSTQGMNYELYGNKYIRVPNEPEAIVINYYVSADQPAGAKVMVADASGATVRQLDGPARKGVNRVLWPLAGAGGRGGGRGGAGGNTAPPAVGDYRVTVSVAGEEMSKTARVRNRIGVQ